MVYGPKSSVSRREDENKKDGEVVVDSRSSIGSFTVNVVESRKAACLRAWISDNNGAVHLRLALNDSSAIGTAELAGAATPPGAIGRFSFSPV